MCHHRPGYRRRDSAPRTSRPQPSTTQIGSTIKMEMRCLACQFSSRHGDPATFSWRAPIRSSDRDGQQRGDTPLPALSALGRRVGRFVGGYIARARHRPTARGYGARGRPRDARRCGRDAALGDAAAALIDVGATVFPTTAYPSDLPAKLDVAERFRMTYGVGGLTESTNSTGSFE